MVWFLYVVSILFVVLGAVLVLYTDWIRKSMKSGLGKKNTRLLGLIPLVFGILMVISAAWSEVFWLILIIGVIILAGGAYLLFGSKEKLDTAITWWLGKASDRSYRFWGLILIILGIALLSWIQ